MVGGLDYRKSAFRVEPYNAVMAAEGKLVEPKQGLSMGLRPASLTNFTKQDKVSEKEGSLSDATHIYSSSTTSGKNNDLFQEPTAERGNSANNIYGNRCIQGMHLANESLPCYISGYGPYDTGSMVGLDGKYSGPKPNVPVAGPTAALKSRHSNSVKMSGPLDSRTPVNSKSFMSTPSSNFSKYSLQSQHLNLSKVPQLDLRTALLYRSSQSAKSFSSSSNQVQELFPNSPSSYRPNGQITAGYDGYKMGEKSNRSITYEAQKESARGPRSRGLLLNPSNEEQFGPRVRRDRYNRSDFLIKYENAKFFVIKSYSEDDIHKSIKYDVWSSTPNGNRKLNAAFHDADARYDEKGSRCPIFLFFSVNGSGQFLGLAEMIGPVDFEKDMDFWQQDKWNGFFPLRWHIIKDIPNNRLRHIILENNDNKPVTYTRDTQEVGLNHGLEMLSIFRNYSALTSMLDDYKYYEDQEKLLQLRKSSRAESRGSDNYRPNDFAERNFEAGRRKAEQVPLRASNLSEQYTSLAALARNLSLNHKNNNAGNYTRNISNTLSIKCN